MTRIVRCKKLNKELPGLAMPPMPGALGLEIFENLSQEAWNAWMSHQTMLINEKRLNLMDKQDREYLTKQLRAYIDGDNYDQADGYVPEEQS